jgi:riboflavin kinase/FMN adenylyltransferase
MQIIEWPQFLIEALPSGGLPSAITVGVFDGVHRGHKALIECVVSRKDRSVPVVVTFRQNPCRKTPGDAKEYPGDILSFRQKMLIFESLGVSITIVVDFSESFRSKTGMDFLGILQKQGNMGFMAVGSNFRCGYQLDTDAPTLQGFNARQDIETCIVQPITEDNQPISSSQIRSAITRGKLFDAAAMLGRPFILDLCVVSHSSQGKVTGNNIVYDIAGQGRILPPSGKYSAFLHRKKNRQDVKAQIEVCVEHGSIIISKDSLDDKACLDSLEFLPL